MKASFPSSSLFGWPLFQLSINLSVDFFDLFIPSPESQPKSESQRVS